MEHHIFVNEETGSRSFKSVFKHSYFANGPVNHGSILGQVKTKDSKMVLDASSAL